MMDNEEAYKEQLEAIGKKLRELNKERDAVGQRYNEIRRRLKDLEKKKLEEATGVEVYSASDYAGLRTADIHFYYGYEETQDGEWCFTVDVKSKVHQHYDEVMRIPESQLKQNDVVLNLLHGIGQWIAKERG